MRGGVPQTAHNKLQLGVPQEALAALPPRPSQDVPNKPLKNLNVCNRLIYTMSLILRHGPRMLNETISIHIHPQLQIMVPKHHKPT